MVSLRCKMVVKAEVEKLHLTITTLDLGMVQILEDITDKKKVQLKNNLAKWGLELLDDKKSILIDKIKSLIIEMIHYEEDLPKLNYSDYIAKKLKYEYNYLSTIFSEVKGVTIQQFIIQHKIERVKELLLYDQLTISEIADKLHYSSVGHLSSQFKKITGHTPSFFKSIKEKRNSNLENL